MTRILGNNLPLTWFRQFRQLLLPTAQAGWRNIPNPSQQEVVTEETCHPVVFVSKLTYCLPLPDSPNLEGLLHMLAGLMQPLGVFKCEILVKKPNRKAKLLIEVVTPERTIFCLLNNNLLQP